MTRRVPTSSRWTPSARRTDAAVTGSVVNLNRARKQKARAEKEECAAQNRAAYGRTKEEKSLAKAQAALERERLEAGRREKAPADGETS